MFVRNPRALRWAVALCIGAAAMLARPSPAAAQYFGRNQVQYRTFDFRILRTARFDIYFYPEEEAAARDAARYAERWYARLSRVLDYEFENRQPLILYASAPHFAQNTIIGEPGEGTGGVTEAFKQRIVLPFGGTIQETDHVIGHELVHAFQYDITGVGRAGAGLDQAAQRFNNPLWFTEGMAEYLSIGPVDPQTAMWMRDAALTGRLPTLRQLNYDPSFFPYRWGQALWAYVGGRWGDAAVGQILKQTGQGVPFDEAFQRIVNTDLETIIADWHTSIRRTYLPLLSGRREAREEARALVTESGRGGRYNVGPAVSPDGRQMVFLSELDDFDVQLYLANAETGEVTRRLIKGPAFDPHFGSLRFINSAGAFAPDGRRFAFSALRRDRDVVVVIDVRNGRILREYAIPDVSEVSSPSWSPDGNTVVFSGNRGGVTDIWTVDVRTGAARQLTNDPYGDLHPAYSPDGRTIAFATERGTTPDSLRYQRDVRIALMDVASGAVRIAPAQDRSRNINPQWTRDGTGLYFVSDRSGISNVYRVDVTAGRLTQVTNLFTGVSGVTALSPTLSVATQADRMVFSAYERGAHNLYSISNAAELAGTEPAAVQFAGGSPIAAILPPAPRPTEPAFNRVAASLADPAYGLPTETETTQYAVVPYRPRLSLDYLGQPQLGVGASTDPYQRGGVYGGIGGIFSDQLGRHTVYATVQAQGRVEEIGGSVAYINRANRWNYGLTAQRIPIVYAQYGSFFDPQTGQSADVLQTFRLFDTSIGALTQYPISRVQRVEFSAGARHIAQDVRIQQAVNTPGRGVEYTEELEELESFNLGEGSAALVYDNALSGYTSPFAGQRYRFEVAPTVGTLNFTQLTADYRRYIFLRPFTLAVRGWHFGRYGRDESRLNPIYLGYPSVIRGYSSGNVSEACREELEARITTGAECGVLDQLVGSRFAVANAEIRFPLLRQVVVGSGIGLPPVEGFGFVDAGTAYGDQRTREGGVLRTRPNFRRGIPTDPADRGLFTSAGVGARINLLGYVIVEGVYVNALDRPTGWHWQFSLQPGF
ncbi:MAG TPA: BamA/TamA family outer membrane protein [Longimicrobium sp.]|nr:BamA/TamA family outer membrane protein [Longimicrobium sp.]